MDGASLCTYSSGMEPSPVHPAPVFTSSAFWRKYGVASLALMALVVLAYLPALRAGFIWDDDLHFTTNPRMLSWHGLWEIWTTRWALYFPLTSTSFWVLRRLIGLTPWAYHLVNLMIHAGAAVLLWRVLSGFRLRGAWLGAALFALHPVQVETVAWISELKNTQSLFFLLLSVWYLLRSGLLPDNQWRDRSCYTWSLVWFFAALMSKASVATFPAVLLVLLWWQRRWRGWASVQWTLPFFLPSVFFALWTIWEQRYNSGADGAEWSAGLADRVVTAARLVVFYAEKLAWPDPLMFIYPSLRLSAAHLSAWMPVLAVAGVLAGLAINARDWGRPLLVVALCYLILLFPVLGFFNVYFMRYADAADHFQYLASVVPLAGLGILLQTGLDRLPARACRWAWLLPAGLIMVLGWMTFRYVPVFHSPETLWRDCVAKNDQAWMAHNNLGLIHLERGELDLAERHLRTALAVHPQHYEAHSNLGVILFRRGDLAGAQTAFETALRHQPRLVHALVNLGGVHEKRGDRAGAEACYRQALEVNPGQRDAQARLAALCEQTGRVAEALEHYRVALRASTGDGREHMKFMQQRAAQMMAERRWADAALFVEEAERLWPGDAHTGQLRAALLTLQDRPR